MVVVSAWSRRDEPAGAARRDSAEAFADKPFAPERFASNRWFGRGAPRRLRFRGPRAGPVIDALGERLLELDRCVGVASDRDGVGWRGYRVELEVDGGVPELAFFCPSCQQRELDC